MKEFKFWLSIFIIFICAGVLFYISNIFLKTYQINLAFLLLKNNGIIIVVIYIFIILPFFNEFKLSNQNILQYNKKKINYFDCECFEKVKLEIYEFVNDKKKYI